MGTLEISLLGGFQLRVDGAPLDPIPSRTARSLLAFLAMNRDRSHTRDLLAGVFWPDLSDSGARRRLSKALWQIRACIDRHTNGEQRHVVTTGGAVHLNPRAALRLDVELFHELLGMAHSDSVQDPLEETRLLEDAVSLYKGDLLEGFYDDWALSAREGLRADLLRAVRRLCDLTAAKGDYEAALIHARRLTQYDTWGEDGHRRVMRFSVLLGRHNDAIRQYQLCCRTLRNELGAEPSRVTRELYEAMLQDRESAQGGLSRAPRAPLADALGQVPLVGREHERSTLLRKLDSVLTGSGSVALVEGAAGVGKTRLLEEVAEDARWRGFTVLWGRAPESSGRPYACLAEALSAGLTLSGAEPLIQQLRPVWIRQLARLVPGLPHAIDGELPAGKLLRPSEEHVRVMESITLAFVALAGVSPLMLVLDDMHWADRDTIQALAHLTARLESQPILMVVCYRQAEARERPEVWAFIRSLDQRPSCSRVALQACSLGQTEELVRLHLGLPDADTALVRHVFESTGGLPLLIVELLRPECQQELTVHTSGAVHPPCSDQAPALSTYLRDIVGGRLQDVQEDARELLALLAVQDGDLSLPEIIAASKLSDSALVRAIDSLTQRRLVVRRLDSYQLAHGLLRRVVYEDLPPSVREDLHGRVGLAVQAHRPQEVELLAHHFWTAHLPDLAAHYLEQSAVRAMAVSAYESAAQYLAQAAGALEEAGAAHNRRFRVASLREEALDILARRAEQEAALADMQQYASADDLIEVMRRRSWWLANQDRFAEAETEARRALDLARTAGDTSRVVATLSTLGMIACVAGRAADGVLYLEEAATCRGVGLRQQADARNALGQNLLDLQRFDEAEPQLLAALALYSELEHTRGEAEVLGMLGTLRMERGESVLAESALQRALELSRAIGYRQGEAVYRMNLGILHALNNRPALAFEEFREAAATYDLIGNLRGRALVLSNTAWLRHAVLGEDQAAEEDARFALQAYRKMDDKRGEAQCLGTLGSVLCRRGEGTESTDAFREARGLAREARDSWIEGQILREWARCCLETSQIHDGLAHADEALVLCKQLDMRDLAVSLNALRGRLLVELDRNEEALAATSAALAGLQPGAGVPQSVAFYHSLVLAAHGRAQEADDYLGAAYQHVMTSVSDLSEGDRRASLTSVPAHRAIVEAWSARQPKRECHILARADAPTGRSLTPEEQTPVTWTIDSPADQGIQSVASRRRHRLLRLLTEAKSQGGSPTIPDLALALRVSVATVRRDLAALRDSGLDARTRGFRTASVRRGEGSGPTGTRMDDTRITTTTRRARPET